MLIHQDGGRRAALTRTLTGTSDWRRRLVDAIVFARVGVAGAAALPDGGRWPWPEIGPDDLEGALRAHFPTLRMLGAVVPRQRDRRRLSLLCHAAGNALVVKLGADEPALRAEHLALELLTADPLPGIATPRPCGVGHLSVPHSSGLTPVLFLATSALGLWAQRPAIDAPLRTFEDDLGKRLGSLPRPPGGDARLVPVHGDLTPWNLRRTARGLALFDWEAVGWGPSGADIARYRRTADEIRPRWRRAPEWPS